MRSTFKVCRPKGWKVKSLILYRDTFVEHPSTESETADLYCEEWSAADVAPPSFEARSPRVFPHKNVIVQLVEWTVDGEPKQGFETPEQLSDWEFIHHYDPMRQVTPEIQAQADEIVKGIEPNPAKRAAALYAWVRDNVTYCAIQLGMGLAAVPVNESASRSIWRL